MGLDIYLHTAEEARQNAEYNRASEEWYGGDDTPEGAAPYHKASKEERDERHREHSNATQQRLAESRLETGRLRQELDKYQQGVPS